MPSPTPDKGRVLPHDAPAVGVGTPNIPPENSVQTETKNSTRPTPELGNLKSPTPQASKGMLRQTGVRFLKELIADNPKLAMQRLGLMVLDNSLLYSAYFSLGQVIRNMPAKESTPEFLAWTAAAGLLLGFERGFAARWEERARVQQEKEIERSMVRRVADAVRNTPIHLCEDRSVDKKIVELRSNEMFLKMLGNNVFELTRGVGNVAIATVSLSVGLWSHSPLTAVLFPLAVVGAPALYALRSAEQQAHRRIALNEALGDTPRIFNYLRQRLLTAVGAMGFRLSGKSDQVTDSYMRTFDKVAESKDLTDRENFKTQTRADRVSQLASFAGFAKLVQLGLGPLSVGGFVFLNATLGKAHLAMQEVCKNLGDISERLRFLTLLHDLEDLGRTSADKRKRVTFETPPEIVIKDLKFTYEGADKPALKIDSLVIPSGSRVVLVGENGAGKSTFIKLICGVKQPTEGSIQVGGHDTKDVWYPLSYIQQNEPDFAASTVRDAIDFRSVEGQARPLEEVLERTGVAEFLAGKKHGLDTRIGPFKDGSGFSGGQIQRITLAASLLSAATLKLRDEALTALDPPTQIALAALLDEERGAVTSIDVTHHLAAARGADLILVFEKGTISAAGSHEQLMADPESWYARHFTQQAKEYSGAKDKNSETIDLKDLLGAINRLPQEALKAVVEEGISKLSGAVPAERGVSPGAPPPA